MAARDKNTNTDQGDADGGIASQAQNESLEHSEGDMTTRNDALDLGVPMLPGDPREPVGPEDALGEGPTRGDYSQRIGPDSYHPHTSIAIPDAAPGEPNVRVVSQRGWVEQGEVPGKKGGVNSAEGA